MTVPGLNLDGVDRLVAECHAVMYPQTLTGSVVSRLLAELAKQADIGRIRGEDVRTSIERLTDHGVLLEVRTGYRQCRKEFINQLTASAHGDDYMYAMLSLHEDTAPGRQLYKWGDRLQSWARCHVLAGRYDELDALADAESIDWSFLAESHAGDMLERLPAGYVEEALPACLAFLALNLRNPEPLATQAEGLLAACPAAAGPLAFVRVLQGQFDVALALFDRVPAEPQHRAQRLAAGALTSMISGQDDHALAGIEAALEAERGGSRKRILFPNGEMFSLSLLALVRLDTAPANALLAQLHKNADKLDVQSHTLLVSGTAQEVRDGSGDGLFPRGYVRFDALVQGWQAQWMNDFAFYTWGNHSHALAFVLREAIRCGWQWVAAELATVAQLAQASGSWEDDADISELVEAGLAARAELGCQPIGEAVAPKPPWEHSLKALEQAAFEAGKRKTRPREPRATAKKRLMWEIERFGEHVELTPREQGAKKSGGWTRGRPVALSRLSREAATLEFLLDQDRQAATRIKKQRSWGSSTEWVLEANGVYALAGHPHVFNNAGESVEIVEREPELVVTDGPNDTVEVYMTPAQRYGENYLARAVSDRRVEVTRFEARHKRLLELIGDDGLKLPEAARERLLAAVSQLAADVQVRSEVEGIASAVGITVSADPQPYVRLVPGGEGLSVSVVVEPIPASGNLLIPGAGTATVIVHQDGQVVQTRRDLAQERQHVGALVERHPLLAAATDGSAVVLDDPGDCLELVDALHADGVRCLWPEGEPFKVVARANASSLHLTVNSAEQWFSASGQLEVDDALQLGLGRLFELLDSARGQRFIEVDAGRFVALSAGFRRQLDDLRSLSSPAAGGALRIHPLAALALDDLADAAQLQADDSWQQQRVRLAEAEQYMPELPGTLDAELRPYQVEGFAWLARLAHWGAGACLADDMGLGKTLQSLALFLHRATGGPALVVAPTSVAGNWIAEARRFAPTLNVHLYGGAADGRAAMLDSVGRFDLVVVTYGLLQNDIDRFADVAWHSVLLDEAQAIKNAATQRARAVRRLRGDFRFVTTGTPVQNHLTDLHSLFAFINPGMLGSEARFRRDFVLPVERDNDVLARDRLRRLIAPFVLRRLKNEVLADLPARTEVTLQVELSPQEAALYESLRERALKDLTDSPASAGSGGTGVKGSKKGKARKKDATSGENTGETHLRVLAHLTRLRLACCNPKLVLEGAAPASSKLKMFADTLDELLQNRHKVLVFSQFVTHLKLIEAHLQAQDISYQYLDGQTPAAARQARVDAFQSGEGDVFLISLKAGGAGLNLTAADYVIHMDPWWNPAVEDQASDRAHRIGQTRPVTIYRLVASGTIEEQIVALHHRKRELADSLLAGADVAAQLSLDDLIGLLRDPA